jgi:hypothetical protein
MRDLPGLAGGLSCALMVSCYNRARSYHPCGNPRLNFSRPHFSRVPCNVAAAICSVGHAYPRGWKEANLAHLAGSLSLVSMHARMHRNENFCASLCA